MTRIGQEILTPLTGQERKGRSKPPSHLKSQAEATSRAFTAAQRLNEYNVCDCHHLIDPPQIFQPRRSPTVPASYHWAASTLEE
jgi:hypothetical protein